MTNIFNLSNLAWLAVLLGYLVVTLPVFIGFYKKDLEDLKVKNVEHDDNCLFLIAEITSYKQKLTDIATKKMLNSLSTSAAIQREKNKKKFMINERRKETMLQRYGVPYAFLLKNESKNTELSSD